jgi:septal ring-binding cell division protein DamX
VALRDNWNCSETLLKDGLVIAGSGAQLEVEAEALKVGRSETTAAVEQVAIPKASVNKALVQKLPLKKVPLKKVPVKKAPDTRFPKFDISATGYTVQLGAYLSQALAERAADNMILPGGELRIRDIVTAERRFFVLVYGRYQTRQQAEVASEPLVVLNSGLTYWIRSIASMGKRD